MIFKKYMDKALEKNILVKENGEGKSNEELNREAQEYFLENTMQEIKVESDENDKSSGFRMFKTKDGGTATFCFNFRN